MLGLGSAMRGDLDEDPEFPSSRFPDSGVSGNRSSVVDGSRPFGNSVNRDCGRSRFADFGLSAFRVIVSGSDFDEDPEFPSSSFPDSGVSGNRSSVVDGFRSSAIRQIVIAGEPGLPISGFHHFVCSDLTCFVRLAARGSLGGDLMKSRVPEFQVSE